MNLEKYKDNLLFLPLGGSGEIGMNLNLYHLDGKWIVVDCGVGFADDYYPGADLIVPDISFIQHIKKDILAMIITHAHEDHVGAVQYLWPDFECPIYTTKFTANFLKAKLLETHFGKLVKIHEIEPNKKFNLGPFEIEPIELTHSIPEMNAMAITTRYGTVMHTGDWKFDEAPVVGPASDYAALKRVGDEGVLAMVCDSTNVFSNGVGGSETEVKESLVRLIAECKNRVAVGTFASNLGRVETIIHAAEAAGREIVVCGRSFWRLIDAARESGYLQNAPKLWKEQEVGKIPPHKCLLMCTGSQAEPRAAFSRIAEGTHPNVRLQKGDTAIFSSKVIPGNDTRIFRMFNLLTRMGVEVITEKDHFVHVSGHPYRDELKRMYELTKPKISIPVHGEARHIHEHAKLAKQWGSKFTFEPVNGDLINIAPNDPQKIAIVKAGKFAIDGFSFLAGDSEIMKSRRRLRVSGAVFVSIVLDKKGNVLELPKISAPGALDLKQDSEMLQAMAEDIQDVVDGKKDLKHAEENARKVVRRYLRDELDKNPIIEVHISKV